MRIKDKIQQKITKNKTLIRLLKKRNEELQREANDAKNSVSQALNSYSAEQLSKVHDTSKISMNVLDISI